MNQVSEPVEPFLEKFCAGLHYKLSNADSQSSTGARRSILLAERASGKLSSIAMTCFVTGASGFVGANLVLELIRGGHKVKILLRPGSDFRTLQGADCEKVLGDVSERATLEKALRGVDWCFHAAASYHLWLRDYRPMYAANVEGTRNVLEAAGVAGCKRIVYTSTVGCIGLPREINGKIEPTDEATPVDETQMANHYKRSKWRAEQVARELAGKGLPVVIVNPTAPIGPCDAKPTPTGKIIVDFLNGKMPGYVDTGLNWVHVRDVAAGHIAAAEKGRLGERYILGNAAGNWTMKETLAVLAELSGAPAPKMRVPYWTALLASYVDEGISAVSGKPPKAPLAGVRMARYKMFFNPAKAVRELGLPQTPPREAFADAIRWFRENGYVGARKS
jgi:dihydroflavonol-4-reductase